VDGQLELRKRCKIVAGQTVTFGGRTIAVTP
jgi:ribosome-associated protein YbcJ (S4-like RNA binding protein)